MTGPNNTPRSACAAHARLGPASLVLDDVPALDALDGTGGTGRALEHKWWPG